MLLVEKVRGEKVFTLGDIVSTIMKNPTIIQALHNVTQLAELVQ
jgi:hypothetical protein